MQLQLTQYAGFVVQSLRTRIRHGGRDVIFEIKIIFAESFIVGVMRVFLSCSLGARQCQEGASPENKSFLS